MIKKGHIYINITGKNGNISLTPDNYDIKEIKELLENVENLLFPYEKRNRSLVSYKIEKGSVINNFQTSMQHIIAFNALLGEIKNNQDINFLETPTAKAFENFQISAKKRDFTFTFRTSLKETTELQISKETQYYRAESTWLDAEFYFYGKITNAGGKEKANIHLLTEELGSIIIDTPKSYLEETEDNLLYKFYGLRVEGKQNSVSGEIDKQSLKFKDLIDYSPKYDENYLNELQEKAKHWINTVNPDDWLRNLRGYDA